MQINNRNTFQQGGLIRPKPITPPIAPPITPPVKSEWDTRVESDISEFKKKVPLIKDVQGNARLHYYKGILDKQLEAKNPEAWKRSAAQPIGEGIANRVHAADSMINNKKYNYAVTDEEIRNTPEIDYDDFNNLRNTLSNRFGLDVAGAGEVAPTSAGTAYGLRNSWSITPAEVVYKNSMEYDGTVQPTSETGAGVTYDPVTKGYKYEYREPKVYPDPRLSKKLGGLLKR